MARATTAEIMASERLRISSILNSPEGIKRPLAARKLALEHGMDAVSAVELLADMPSEESPYMQALSRETIGIAPAGGGFDPLARADPKEARKAEIAASMAGYNESRGYTRRTQ